MKIQHSSPTGALEVPALGAVIEPGKAVDVPETIGKALLQQSDLWETPEKAAEREKAEAAKAEKEATK